MQPAPAHRIRLDSWKQIAAYLNKSERTVRRWQEVEGLPVHKHLHLQRGSVWAFEDELDDWLRQRTLLPESPETASAPEMSLGASGPKRRWWWLALAGFLAAAGLYSLSRPALPKVWSKPILITTLPGAEQGSSVSPDGNLIAFQWNQPESDERGVFVKNLSTNSVTPLTVSKRDASYLYSPAWSPDGRTVALLERTADQQTWLCLVPATGGDRRRLLQIASPPTLFFGSYNHLSWSRDGKSVIVPMSLGANQGVYRVSIDTGDKVAIAQGHSIHGPSLSPDGRRLVVFQNEGVPILSESVLLFELGSDGGSASAPKILHKAQIASAGIAWLPDSKSLVLCKSQPTILGRLDAHLFELKAHEGAILNRVSDEACNTVTATPDGSIFFGAIVSPRSTLAKASLDSPQEAEAFLPSSQFDDSPIFSPDGKHLAFYSTRSGAPEIWIASVEGSKAWKAAQGKMAYSAPAWSADSDRLAFVSGTSILVVRKNGQMLQTVDLGGSVAQNLVWSADGSAIYYIASSHLWKVELSSSNRQAIREVPPVLLAHSEPAANYFYYATARNPYAVFRLPFSGGPESLVKDGLTLPAFTLTGNHLYYVGPGKNIYRSDLKTGREQKLNHSEFDRVAYGNKWQVHFTVSPDDRTIVWTRPLPDEVDLHQLQLEQR